VRPPFFTKSEIKSGTSGSGFVRSPAGQEHARIGSKPDIGYGEIGAALRGQDEWRGNLAHIDTLVGEAAQRNTVPHKTRRDRQCHGGPAPALPSAALHA